MPLSHIFSSFLFLFVFLFFLLGLSLFLFLFLCLFLLASSFVLFCSCIYSFIVSCSTSSFSLSSFLLIFFLFSLACIIFFYYYFHLCYCHPPLCPLSVILYLLIRMSNQFSFPSNKFMFIIPPQKKNFPYFHFQHNCPVFVALTYVKKNIYTVKSL